MTIMPNILDIIGLMRNNSIGIRFNDLCKFCAEYFAETKQSACSHRINKTQCQNHPRCNNQNSKSKGESKPYQIRQVLLATYAGGK